jgi:LCP family protein required for cell wall assembly
VRRVLAGFLSMIAPGAGQLYEGARRRGLILLAAFTAAIAALALLAATHPLDAVAWAGDPRVIAAFLAFDGLVLGIRLFAVVDAWRAPAGAATPLAVLALAVLAALTVAPHVAAGYMAVRGHVVLEAVFADEEPKDVLPARGVFLAEQSKAARVPEPGVIPATHLVRGQPLESSRLVVADDRLARPWVTILLLGGDSGPGIFSERTDTMIVAALERGTGRAVAFGIPRNLVEVPLGGVAGRTAPRFHEPLNALYEWALARPELFPGGQNAGATALKQTISRLLGIRVDYFAHVDLDGFRDVVDALGGVTIHVKERLVDEVTRPAWGETKPRINVYPGRTYHFDGRTALAYVRSRKASNDYRRMARQRCFLSAVANQLDVSNVLRHFDNIASTVQHSVRTDIPLARVPDLIRLAGALDSKRTLTVTFGPPYIARRRKSDRYPLPNIGRIRATARESILDPTPRADEDVETVAKSC